MELRKVLAMTTNLCDRVAIFHRLEGFALEISNRGPAKFYKDERRRQKRAHQLGVRGLRRDGYMGRDPV